MIQKCLKQSRDLMLKNIHVMSQPKIRTFFQPKSTSIPLHLVKPIRKVDRMPRLPDSSDFPSSLNLSITPTPTNQPPVNILILLHGLGDTHIPFASLAKALNLPETACISLQAPSPIPALFTGSDLPSFHWGDDVLFDDRSGELDLDAGFKTAGVILKEVIEEILVKKCGFEKRGILLYGFGQGAMAALSIVASEDAEFGGVVSIGGKLPESISSSSLGSGKQRFRTPILVLGGSKSKQITRSAVDGLKARFNDVEYVKWEKSDDSMPRSREEMLPIMKFFARRLRSRAGVPKDAVEI